MGAFLKIAPERLRNPVMISSLAALLAMYVGYFFAFVVTPLDLDWSGRETTQIVGDPPGLLCCSRAASRPKNQKRYSPLSASICDSKAG